MQLVFPMLKVSLENRSVPFVCVKIWLCVVFCVVIVVSDEK